MPFFIFFIILFLANKEFRSKSKENYILILNIIFRCEDLNISTCLPIYMEIYISLFCPFWNSISFVCRWEIIPPKNFSWLIIINQFLLVNLYDSCAFTNIIFKVYNCSIHPIGDLLWIIFYLLRWIILLSYLETGFSFYFLAIIYSQIKYQCHNHCFSVFLFSKVLKIYILKSFILKNSKKFNCFFFIFVLILIQN